MFTHVFGNPRSLLICSRSLSLALTHVRVGFACEERSEASLFQWRTATMTMLPPFRKFIAWLNVQSEWFYRKAKASPTERVSSKQIGERLTADGKGGKCDTTNILWALFCYEMSFSYDQEERLVAAYRNVVAELKDSCEHRARMRQGEMLVDRVGDGVKKMMGAVERREEAIVFGALSAQQSARLKVWCSDNQERVKKYFGNVGVMTRAEREALVAADREQMSLLLAGGGGEGKKTILEEMQSMKQLLAAMQKIVND